MGAPIFICGFATATHAYYVPYDRGPNSWHGNAVRVSLADFSISGIEVLDLAASNVNLKGFWGGFATATHAYYVPYFNGALHGNAGTRAVENRTNRVVTMLVVVSS